MTDTVPVTRPPEVKPETPVAKNPLEEAVKPVIKTIPKSKKQLKPLALPGNLPVKPGKIVKPKIIIKRVGSLGL